MRRTVAVGMADVLDSSAIERWQREPICFVEEILRDPETVRPFQLFEAERQFLHYAYQRDESGRLVFPEQCFGAPKKTGKTGLAAAHLLTMTCLFGGRFAEGYALANDLEQAQGRVFQAVRRICEASPHLQRECNITQSRIDFPQTGAVITAVGSDYASASGANPVCSSFDELWAFTSERAYRLWDEMVPVPTRKVSCRLVTTYAGFEGESVLLESLYKRGLSQPQVAPSLYAGDGLLMAWHHEPCAPWQDERWLADMRRTLRPNQYLRMVENRFVTSETSFIDMAWWDRCVDSNLTPVAFDRALAIYIGIDASVKHDSTAVVATTWDKTAQRCRLVWHNVFQPTPEQPLDFEATIETAVLELRKRFHLRKVLYDPYQMAASAQRLTRAGVKMEETPQSPPVLTVMSQNLYELLRSGGLHLYPDANMRTSISRAIAIETPRGWRIAKEKQRDRIDVVVALAMSALGSVRGQSESSYNLWGGAFSDDDPDSKALDDARYRAEFAAMVYRTTGIYAR
jgi:phage terminase large subunit-like protein